MPAKKELLPKYGDWTVSPETRSGRTVECKCVCGTVKQVNITSLQKGTSTGCGCKALKKCELTWQKKHGGKSPLCNPEIKAKKEKTMTERYGTPHALQNPELLAKTRQKCFQTTGFETNVVNPEVAKKAKQKAKEWKENNKDRIVANTTKYYIDKKSSKTLREYCKERDLPYATAKALARVYGIEYAVQYLNQYVAGVSLSSLENRIADMIPSTVKIKYRGRSLPCFNGQDHVKYRPDLYIEHKDAKIAINADGLYWHAFPQKDKDYHMIMREVFERYNIKMLQFREDEIRDKPDIVKSMIYNALGKSQTIYARKTEVKKLTPEQLRSFMTRNHLMGHANSAGYGLFFNGELVSAIGVKRYKTGIDITRFACQIGLTVVGGLSKLLAAVAQEYDPDFIVSYVDLRYGNGSSLEKCGFGRVSTHLSWQWTDLCNTYNRLYCRANMDDRKLSEKEYAKEMKLHKIYDAGQAKYLKILKPS